MRSISIVNLTPHALNVQGRDGATMVTIQPSGTVARCASASEVVETVLVDGVEIDISRTVFGEVSGVPAPQDGVVYAVSMLVASALRRADVVSPGSLLRDAEGRPLGCIGLSTQAD